MRLGPCRCQTQCERRARASPSRGREEEAGNRPGFRVIHTPSTVGRSKINNTEEVMRDIREEEG